MNALNHTGSQTFSFERYKVLLKKYLIENGKTIGLYTTVFLGFTVLVAIFLGVKLSDDGSNIDIANIFMGQYSLIVFGLGTAISSALMFSSMQDKAGRIGTLMLPASYVEKFAVRTTVYLAIYIITACIVLSIGEGVRYISCPSPHYFKFAVLSPLNFDTEGVEMDYSFNITTLILSIIGSHATYTLGSILWPRKSFLKTTAAIMIVEFVLVILIPFKWLIENAEYLLPFMEFNNVKLIYYSFIIVVSIIEYTIAIYLFRKSQVVQRMM